MNLINDILLNLNLIDGIGQKSIEIITNNFDMKKEKLMHIYNYSINELEQMGLSNSLAIKVFNGLKDKKIFEKEKELIEKNKIKILTPYDNEYPILFKEAKVFPILYIKNKCDIKNIFNNSISLSIVSSRKTNDYGIRAINYFISALKDLNINIISGGAIGGDAFIHEAALRNKIKTISIIGSGLLQLYPASNRYLFEKIFENEGLIISPFSIRLKAHKGTFPVRNSIIAGISLATLVIQGSMSSGTLITAQRALDFSRDVGAIPGYFNDELSKGCHYLIKEGALLIESPEDLYSMLRVVKNIYNENNLNKNENIHSNSNELILENKILKICDYPKTVSEISELIKIEEEKAEEILFILLSNNKIKTDVLGRWISNI